MTTTLDNKEISYGISVPSGTAEGMYRYNVFRNYTDLTANGELVFAGNFYYNGTSSTAIINVTDIARSLKYTSNIEAEANCQPAKLVQWFRIIAYFGGTTVYSSWYPIAMVYQYPHSLSYTDPDNVYGRWSASTGHVAALQGLSDINDEEYMLVPHYPLIETNRYNFAQSFITGSSQGDFTLDISAVDTSPGELTITLSSFLVNQLNRKIITYDGTVTSSQVSPGYFADYDGADHFMKVLIVAPSIGSSVRIIFSEEIPVGVTSINIYEPVAYSDVIDVYSTASDNMSRTYTCFLIDLLDWDASDLWQDKDIKITEEGDRVIAILDNCYKRYYLMWQDRLGGWQSQPFNDKMIYSEDITNYETIDFGNERHKSQVTVQPKWKLNTDWLSEEVFPLYESIFVSPVLFLFDTQENKKYNVICNGNFTEKKYKNEKKLLSLTLDLESTMQQNIIY